MTRIHITFYGVLKQDAGSKHITLDLPGDAPSVRALADAIAVQYPALAPRLPTVAFAVRDELVTSDHRLANDDRVALLPPVSGG